MFFKNLLHSAKQVLGIGKRSNSGLGGLINKARNFTSSAMGALNSSPIKSLMGSISQHVPQVGDLYKSFKKYGNIANNMLNNNGGEKYGERTIRNSPLLASMDRVGSVQIPSSFNSGSNKHHHSSSIEKASRHNQVDKNEDWLGNPLAHFAGAGF